jgi:hypothetical protein
LDCIIFLDEKRFLLMQERIIFLVLVCAVFLLSAGNSLVEGGRNITFSLLNGESFQKKCCETYYPTQTVFYCNMGGTDYSNSFLYYEADGEIGIFTPEPTGQVFGGEPRVASVQPELGGTVPIGGWELGDIFYVNGNEYVARMINLTTINSTWVVIPGENGGKECVFDRTGTVFNGDLICTFQNSVYRISSDASYSLIATDLNLYEGIDVVPRNESRYGVLSATVLLPCNSPPPSSTGSGSGAGPAPGSNGGPPQTLVASVTTDGNVTYYDPYCLEGTHADQVWISHPEDNFYGLNFGNGFVYVANYSVLEKNNLVGEIVIQCEGPIQSKDWSGLMRMYWNGTGVATEPIYLSPGSALLDGGPWEHGCFTRGGSGNALPGGFSFCFYVNNATQRLGAFQLTTTTIIENYPYSGNASFSYRGVPAAAKGTVNIAIIQDSTNRFYLQIVNGEPATSSSSGSSLSLQLKYNGPSDPDMTLLVQNDPSSSNPNCSYFWYEGQGSFSWSWSSGTTGLVIGPIAAIPLMDMFSFEVTVSDYSGLSGIAMISESSVINMPISKGQSFAISRVSCSCGDGVITDPTLEVCDPGQADSTCCNDACQFKPNSFICATSNVSCTLPSYCPGNGASCPAMKNASNCTTMVDCTSFTNCSSCNAISNNKQCGWCCSASGSFCTYRGSSTCIASSCSEVECVGGCGTGHCKCGSCSCLPGTGGSSCNESVNCNGTLVPANQLQKVDVCGVCGGNGQECLGCNGLPYGPKYDVCGVCGGNGSSCYNPCPTQTDCFDCADLSQCVWCATSSICYDKSTVQTCPNEITSSSQCGSGTSGISPVVLGSSIGAGVIAGIAIGAAVFVGIAGYGSKKGYDHWKQKSASSALVSDNPLYEEAGTSHENALYTE